MQKNNKIIEFFHKFFRKKNQIINNFRTNLAVLLFDKKNSNEFSHEKIHEINKIIFLQNDNKIGDMIVATLAFREIRRIFPNAFIYVIAAHDTIQLIQNNQNINDSCIFYSGIFKIFKFAKKLKKMQNFDLFIDNSVKPNWQTIELLRFLEPKYSLGFNRNSYKIYNISIPFDFNSNHKSLHHKKILNFLGNIEKNVKCEINTNYDIFIPENIQKNTEIFLKNLPSNRKNIVINPFAASKHRCMTAQQIFHIAKNVKNCNFILIGTNENLKKINKVLQIIENKVRNFAENQKICENIFYPQITNNNLLESFALVKNCEIIVTPDTGFLHCAAAFDKNIIALFVGNREFNDNFNVWNAGPNAKNCNYIFSGASDKDISTIDAAQISSLLQQFSD